MARRAKVSRATAARALGGYGLVGDQTRERIMTAARELNYSANVVARAMRAGTTQTIGVVVADISNSFFSYATRAIIDTAALSGYQTLVLNTDDDLTKEIEAVRVLVEKHPGRPMDARRSFRRLHCSLAVGPVPASSLKCAYMPLMSILGVAAALRSNPSTSAGSAPARQKPRSTLTNADNLSEVTAQVSSSDTLERVIVRSCSETALAHWGFMPG
nr:LacI family DNA-binding transcriptional regulator [Mesorhizobium sp. AR07]